MTGAVRRAIHSSGLTVNQLAERVGIEPNLLDLFLTGERTLRSDLMDRLALELHLEASAPSTA